MYKFLNWYNRNRKEIWIAIIFVAVIGLLCFYFLLELAENYTTEDDLYISNTNTDINNELNTVTLTTEDSVLTGETASNNTEKLKTIDNFIEYCNEANIEEAYNLLSDECKEEIYTDIDIFQTNYYESIFSEIEKVVSMENWINDTYKVEFYDNPLVTGIDSDEFIQDYITIVKNDDGEYKLNINGFIGRTYYSESSEANGLTIYVKEVDTYMDYEIYTFEIVNNSGMDVTLGDLDEEDMTYLVDKNEIKYTAYLHELYSAQLELNIGQTGNIEIKYYNKYISSKEIEYVVFSNITFENDDEDSESVNIQIEL